MADEQGEDLQTLAARMGQTPDPNGGPPEDAAAQIANAREREKGAQAKMTQATEEAARLRDQNAALQAEREQWEGRMQTMEQRMQSMTAPPAAPAAAPAQTVPAALRPEDLVDGDGFIDPAKLLAAQEAINARFKQELLQEVGRVVQPMAHGVGDMAKHQVLSRIPEGPMKDEFQRNLDASMTAIAQTNPESLADPRAVEYLANSVAGQMLQQGKNVYASATPGRTLAVPAVGAPSVPVGPDFGGDPGAPAPSFEDVGVDHRGAAVQDIKRFAQLEEALAEAGVAGGIDGQLRKIAEERAAAEQR